jgi:hypothetical protein
MARTIAEIKAAMVTAKEAESGLAGLTSTSQTAIWDLLFFICAVAIKVIEDLFVVQTENIEERRLEIPVGVLKWYAAESLLYQFGDALVWTDTFVDDDGDTQVLIGNILTYNPVDSDNRIVDLSAADIINGIIVIKVAKITASVAGPLSAPELAGFTTYWTEKRFAGDSISIISNDPDLLKCEYTIEYDPQLLAADGSLLSTPATFPVEDAVDAFLQTFQADDFAGDMVVMKLTDAIQAATGVKNAVATNIEGKPDGGSYLDVLATTLQTYTANAGYMLIDPAFPLSGTLTYTAG